MSSKMRTFAALIAASSLIGAQDAAATQTCFTWNSGSTHLQFNSAFTGSGLHALTGVEFGGLSPCAGLSHWPVFGTAFTKGNTIVMGFRAETVDADGCGAVDYIVKLALSTMSGPLQLHNDRTDSSNKNRLVPASCTGVPAAVPPLAAGPERDAEGNCSGSACQVR